MFVSVWAVFFIWSYFCQEKQVFLFYKPVSISKNFNFCKQEWVSLIVDIFIFLFVCMCMCFNLSKDNLFFILCLQYFVCKRACLSVSIFVLLWLLCFYLRDYKFVFVFVCVYVCMCVFLCVCLYIYTYQ